MHGNQWASNQYPHSLIQTDQWWLNGRTSCINDAQIWHPNDACGCRILSTQWPDSGQPHWPCCCWLYPHVRRTTHVQRLWGCWASFLFNRSVGMKRLPIWISQRTERWRTWLNTWKPKSTDTVCCGPTRMRSKQSGEQTISYRADFVLTSIRNGYSFYPAILCV